MDLDQFTPRRLFRAMGIVAACVAIGILVAYFWSPFRADSYHSTAHILVAAETAADIFEPETPDAAETRLNDQEVALEWMQSEELRAEVTSRLSFAATATSRIMPDAGLLLVTAMDSDPERARLIAQTYAEAYVDARSNELIEDQDVVESTLRSRIDELSLEIDNAAPGVDVEALQTLRLDLLDSYDRLILNRQLGNVQNGRILDDAQLASAPFSTSPRTALNLGLGALLGLLVGGCIAVLDSRPWTTAR